LLQPDWLTIEYLDPAQNALCTGVFYRDPGTPSFTTLQVRNDGSGYYVVYAPVTIGFQEK